MASSRDRHRGEKHCFERAHEDVRPGLFCGAGLHSRKVPSAKPRAKEAQGQAGFLDSSALRGSGFGDFCRNKSHLSCGGESHCDERPTKIIGLERNPAIKFPDYSHAKICDGSRNDLNSRALPLGSLKNMVACSPTWPLNRIPGSMMNFTLACWRLSASFCH